MNASPSFAAVGAETTLGSRDAAFEFETRDVGALAALYRDHVRQVDTCMVSLLSLFARAILAAVTRRSVHREGKRFHGSSSTLGARSNIH